MNMLAGKYGVKALFGSLLVLLTLSSGSFVRAQDITGTILGTVTDTSKAVIGQANVTAINIGTGNKTIAVSGGDGSFAVRVAPGTYDVVAQARGFKTFKVSGVHVLVNEDSRVEAALAVGEASQVVSVHAINNSLDTTSATLKEVVGEKTIQDMPLNGRNPISLALLVPGVTRDPKANVTSGATYPGVSGISVNGTRSDSTNYILDGASNNDNYTNAPNPYPDPDALREFSVQTNNFSAEFGRLAGGVINVVTKSGANQFHGSAFEYLRNNAFNAANHFAAVTDGVKSDDGLKRNQFGATLGGPIFIPRLYSGHDKSFFFASYQGTIVHQRPNATGAVVPDAALRGGNFAALTSPLYVPYDPARSTFAGNQIPLADISPVAQAMLAYIPVAPNGTSTNAQGGQQLFFSSLANTVDNQEFVRVDQRLTAKNTVFGTFWNSQETAPGFLNPTNFLAYRNQGNWISRRYMVDDTHVFGPNLLNEALFSYGHDQYKNTPLYPPQTLPSLGVNVYVPPAATEYQFNVSSYFNLYTGDTNEFIRDQYQAIDTIRLTHGPHQIAFGFEYDYGTGDNINNFQQNPIYGFSETAYTPNPNTLATSTGNSFADFLLGRFSTFTQGAGEYKNTRFNHIAAFAEDTWRVNSKLVLDMGVRYDPFFPYTDLHNKLAVWRPGQQSTLYPNAPPGVLFVGDPGIPKGGFNTIWTNVGPRVGFAYDVAGEGKTSIRGGYGIFFDQPNTITTNDQTDQAPFAPVIHLNGTASNDISNPYAGTTNPFPYPSPPTSNAAFPAYTSQYLYSANMRNDYVEAWNLQVQQALGWETIFSMTYAGSMGVHLPVSRELNPAIYIPGASTTANTNQRRALGPALGSTTLLSPESASNYNSLQFNLDRHFEKSFSVLANYTWSKALDTSSDTKSLSQTVTIPSDPHFDYGPADFDRTNVINVATIWDLPSPNRNPLLREALGGWESTMIANYTGGYPFTIYSGQDNALTGTGNQRADSVPGQMEALGKRSTAASSAHWFNPAAFVTNTLGTYGNTGHNAYRGPSYTDFDIGLLKSFRLKERLNTTFRFEAFNVFNHTNLETPDGTVTDGNFSRITSSYDPRILQFALRLDF